MSPEEHYRQNLAQAKMYHERKKKEAVEMADIMNDNVSSPKHYSLNHKGIECIDAMEAALTPEEFKGYLHGNIIKYIWRYKYKNGLEDLKKGQWYLNKLIATEEKGV